ncbi:MAG TPA: L-serine ammonia-lyase, iron-sulfur-dependent subunit beta [Gemmatimonadaceae bacterium]|nr:L-serine ammonia-lyase, iron-sulfur-dependent subunit beta [Gemmatimonadaceae bacterium]
MVSLLDIIGPVMVGPSSSHTAGACRLGLLARCLVGGTPEHALMELHGSFARTGEGHGTDKALVGGLLGFRPDDERLRDALDIAERESLDYRFDKTTLGDDAHPNTVRITVGRGDRRSVMLGSSLGAGRVLVTEIDGYPVEVTGSYHTIVLVAEDVRGSVARIAGIISDHGLNIATLKLSRKRRGGDAFMVIEVDDVPDESTRDEIRALPWVHWAFRLDKVGA